MDDEDDKPHAVTIEEARATLSQGQIDEFKQAFDIFDEDGGGDISTRELGRVMKLLGQSPTPDQLAQIIEEVDADGSGTIDFDEFLVMMVMQLNEESKGEEEGVLRDCFHLYDVDGDNYIDYPEFKQSLERCCADANPKIEEWEIQTLFADADKNGDAKIDIDEWCVWHGCDPSQ
jgi:troponin C